MCLLIFFFFKGLKKGVWNKEDFFGLGGRSRRVLGRGAGGGGDAGAGRVGGARTRGSRLQGLYFQTDDEPEDDHVLRDLLPLTETRAPVDRTRD